MFVLRLAFWLGVIVLLLPADEQQQARLYGTATSAFERATTFCERNAETCTTASEAWSTFRKKAEFGAKLVRDLANKRQGPDDPMQPARNGGLDGKGSQRGTLSPMDLQPAWRGPGSRTGA